MASFSPIPPAQCCFAGSKKYRKKSRHHCSNIERGEPGRAFVWGWPETFGWDCGSDGRPRVWNSSHRILENFYKFDLKWGINTVINVLKTNVFAQHEHLQVWLTIQSLFKLKDKTNHPSSVVYYGTCTSCKSAYVGESARNFSIRQAEHEDTRKFSEPRPPLCIPSWPHFSVEDLGVRQFMDFEKNTRGHFYCQT